MSSERCPKIHFVTGKGGVGKSTFAKALAAAEARLGKKTLYAELASVSTLESESKEIKPNLSKAQWSGEGCLRAYLKHLIKSEALLKLFWDTPVTKSLVHAAPGLSELSILGKATSGIRHHGPAFDYEVIVIDAYATGHFRSLLLAPDGLRATIRSGPIYEQARTIKEVLLRPEVTSFHIISLAEEYSLQEAQELEIFLKNYGVQNITHWLNKFITMDSTAEPSLQRDILKKAPCFANYLQSILERQKSAQALLPQASTQLLSWVLEVEEEKVVEQLSMEIQKVER